MDFILWIIAVILVISGIVTIFRGRVIVGIVLIIVGLLVGPGGVSIFHHHHHHHSSSAPSQILTHELARREASSGLRS